MFLSLAGEKKLTPQRKGLQSYQRTRKAVMGEPDYMMLFPGLLHEVAEKQGLFKPEELGQTQVAEIPHEAPSHPESDSLTETYTFSDSKEAKPIITSPSGMGKIIE